MKPITKIEGLQQIHEKIDGMKYAMLTCTGKDGILRSRPMATTKAEIDGYLWFFTDDNTEKAEEIKNRSEVNLAYADTQNNVFVSIAGRASIVNDRFKMEQLWNPLFRTYFPKGLDQPNIALLRVEIEEAEYWDTTSSKMTQIVNMAKAIFTGSKPNDGEHKEIKMI
jgi:general stress protein 26